MISNSLFVQGLVITAEHFLLNGGVRVILEEKNYRAVDMIIPIVCGLTDLVKSCIKSSKMNRVHEMYCSLMSTVQ